MRALPPLILKDGYYSAIEAEIKRIFDDLIYRPLLDILGMRMREITSEIKNSRSALLEAIARGTIWYENGQFRGKFNSRTSVEIIKLGGKYDVKSKSYSLRADLLPVELKIAQAQANSRYEALRASILSAIDNIDPQTVDKLSKVKEEYDRTITHMEADLQKTLPKETGSWRDNPAISQISIEAKLTPEQKRIIAEDWGSNLDLYIKGWTQNNILKLRQDIQPHVMAGGRSQGLIKVIEENYGVSRRKAKFLARQETSLLMAKFRETRYADIGIRKYRWSDSHDIRVRHDHHELNGKIFSFAQPPVSNKKTGARNNPGQDYGCRCLAIPIVE